MSIQTLQETLREHAAAVADDGLAGRSTAVRRRAIGMRRRRVAGTTIVAAAVVAAGAVTTLGASPLHRSAEEVVPAGPRTRIVTFEERQAGSTLLDSKAATQGRELVLGTDSSNPVEWWATCYGVGSGYLLHMEIDGQVPMIGGTPLAPAPCRKLSPDDAELGHPTQPTWRPPASPGPHTMRLWITDKLTGTVAQPDRAVLAAAVYEFPAPDRSVAGLPVYREERYYGEIFALAHSDESAPGTRSLTSSYRSTKQAAADVSGLPESSRGYVAIQIVGSGLDGATVELVVDGARETFEAEGGQVNWIWGLQQFGRHTVELRILGDVPPDAQVGVTWRPFVRTAP